MACRRISIEAVDCIDNTIICMQAGRLYPDSPLQKLQDKDAQLVLDVFKTVSDRIATIAYGVSGNNNIECSWSCRECSHISHRSPSHSAPPQRLVVRQQTAVSNHRQPFFTCGHCNRFCFRTQPIHRISLHSRICRRRVDTHPNSILRAVGHQPLHIGSGEPARAAAERLLTSVPYHRVRRTQRSSEYESEAGGTL